MTVSLHRFYKAMADHLDYDECTPGDYAWLLRRIEDEDHPVLGPPIPMSMRPSMDRMLYEVYGPGLRQQINNARPLMAVLAKQRVDR